MLLLRLLLLLPVLRLVQRSALGTPGRLKQFVFDMGIRIASLATSAVSWAQLLPVLAGVVALVVYVRQFSSVFLLRRRGAKTPKINKKRGNVLKH